MSRITSTVNDIISNLQSMATQLSNCNPDGDRALEEVLQPFGFTDDE